MSRLPSRAAFLKGLGGLLLVLLVPTVSCSLYAALCSPFLESLGSSLQKWVGLGGFAFFFIGPLAVLVRLSCSPLMARFRRGTVVAVGFLIWHLLLIGLFPFIPADPRRFLMVRGGWLPRRLLGKEALVTRLVERLFWQDQEQVTIYLDKTGQLAIPWTFGPLSGGFSEGLARVQVEGKSGYLNRQAELVIPAVYGEAGDFSEGLAFVRVEADGKWAVIDKVGKVVVPAKYKLAKPFVQGLAYVESDDERGYIDKTGKLVIPLGEAPRHGFSDGLVDVKTEKGVSYLDTTGATVFELEATDWGPFKTGKATLLDPVSGMWGFIDRQGKWMVMPAFTQVDHFSEQLAAVKSKSEGMWGFIDPEGKMVIPATYRDKPGSFHDGLCQVKVGGHYGFIGNTGKLAIKPSFDRVGDFSGGLAQAYRGGTFGFIDKTGAWVIPPRFPGISFPQPGQPGEPVLAPPSEFAEEVVAAHMVALKREVP